MDFAQHGSVESAGSAQAVDAQGIVAAVFGGPLLVVNYARRNGVLVDVGELVGADYHCALLVVEGLHHLGQGVLVGVYVVRVELNGEFATLGVVDAGVPASADAQVVTLGHDVDDAGVVLELLDGLGRAVGAEVVDDDEVEGEVGLLGQDALDGVADGADAVAHGDDYRSLVLEVALVEVDFVEFGSQIAADFLEMGGAGLLHLNLDAAVLGVDVVKDFFAALAVVQGDVAVEVLVDVDDGGDAAQTQAQVVETGGIVLDVDAGGSLLEVGGVEEEHRAEVEIVAERAELVVDDGRVGLLAFDYGVRVGVHHAGLGVTGEADKAVEGEVAHDQVVVFSVEQSVLGTGGSGDFLHGGRRVEGVDGDYLAAFNGGCLSVGGQQENFGYKRALFKAFHRELHLFGRGVGKEAVDSGFHIQNFY